MTKFLTAAILLVASLLSTQAFVVPRSTTPLAGQAFQQNRIQRHDPLDIRTTPAFSHQATALKASPTDPSMDSSLMKLFLETAVINGVPALFTILVIAFAAFQFRPRKNDMEDQDFFDMKNRKNPAQELYNDLYQGDESGRAKSPLDFFKMFKPPSPASINRGIPPVQYIDIKNLNQKYDSYQFSLTAATESKAKAAAEYRAKNFDRALKLGLTSSAALSPSTKTTLLELERDFLANGSKLLSQIQKLQTALAKDAIDEELQEMGMDPYEVDPLPANATKGDDDNLQQQEREKVKEKKMKPGDKKRPKQPTADLLMAQVATAQRDLMKLELNFVKDVVATVGTDRASGVRAALLGDISSRGIGGLLSQLKERPLSVLLQAAGAMDEEGTAKSGSGKAVFVTKFPGDTTASQVAELREEVTAIVRNAKPGDEALVVLQTGGGTVTGYGLAAAQLLRFKEAGMKLTIAVEQVAASGGYMMCCVADRIVSSPFAVLGSIGVISDIPNVYERLKQEGIEFQTVTAGKYKRTITPTKKVTKEDFAKSKEDVEDILVLFKQFVYQNRPNLDIEKVATGETWFGEDALALNLTDAIATVDQILMEYVDTGYDVFEVSYKPPPETPYALAAQPATSSEGAGLIRQTVRYLVQTVSSEIKAELSNGGVGLQNSSPEKKYMVQDDTADRIRSEYK